MTSKAKTYAISQLAKWHMVYLFEVVDQCNQNWPLARRIMAELVRDGVAVLDKSREDREDDVAWNQGPKFNLLNPITARELK